MEFPPDSAFVSIALASFDTVNGVTLECQFLQSKEISGDTLEKYFRFTFGNEAFRHNPYNEADAQQQGSSGESWSEENKIKTAASHIDSDNLLIITANVMVKLPTRSKCYGLGFIFRKDKVDFFAELTDLLCKECADAIEQIKYIIQQDNSLTNRVTQVISNTSTTMGVLIESRIPGPLPWINTNFSSEEKDFYSRLLYIHLNREMTTVIEAENEDLSTKVFSFLSHFLLRSQMRLSSPVQHSFPVRGLYLQCVKKSVKMPYEHLVLFDKQWTWVRVTSKSKDIIPGPEYDSQIKYFQEFHQINLMCDNEETFIKRKNRLTSYSKKIITDLKTDQKATPKTIPLFNDLMDKLEKTKSHSTRMICQISFRSLIEKSVLLIGLAAAFPGKIQADERKIVKESLGIIEDEELNTLASIAQIFDPNIESKMCIKLFQRLVGSV